MRVLSPLHLTYRRDIDGLRAIAILPVLLFHAFPQILPGGFTGVDVFFVISGYLITGILLKNLHEGRFRFWDFYARRIKRLFPALLAVFMATLVMGWLVLFPDAFRKLGGLTLSGIAFLANFRLLKEVGYFDLAAEQKPLLHLWSLGIEEQFYILWPLILYALHRRPKIVGLALLTLWIGSFSWNCLWVASKPAHTFYLPWTRFWELGTGALLAYGYHHYPAFFSALRRRGTTLGFLGLSLIALGMGCITKAHPFPGMGALLPTLGAALVIIAGPQAWSNRYLLSSKPAVAVGVISYPLYLWHWPILSYLSVMELETVGVRIGALGLSIILATATYHLLEKRIRHRHNRVIYPLMGLMIPLALLAQGIKKGYIPPAIALQEKTRAIALAVDDWKFPGKTMEKSLINGHALYRQGKGPEKILFLGDSNMEQYYPRLEWVHRNTPQKTLLFLTEGGCFPLPGVEDNTHPRCRGLAETALELAKDPAIGTIVLGAQWVGYFQGGGYYFPEQNGALNIAAQSPGQERAFAVFERFLGDLRALGKNVYVILNIPILPNNCPRRMAKPHWTGRWEVTTPPSDRSQWDHIDQGITHRIRHMARQQGAQILDPLPQLCTDQKCVSLTDEGIPIYKDSGHLRASYVRTQATFLDRILEPGKPYPKTQKTRDR